jgi:putative membrane protein
MHYGDWNNGWGLWWMAVMMILFWGGLIWIAVRLVQGRNFTSQRPTSTMIPPPPTRQAPHEILAERLARGEIEPDDYHQRLDDLQRR